MKKTVLPFFSILLVLTLALSSFSIVTAEGSDDPWVTPVSGDLEFNAEVIPLASLPGTIELGNQMLVPAGFPEGEVQFGGNGVRVTGFDGGKATLCYTLTAKEVAVGWGGKFGSWDGSKWTLLPTTIAPVPEEGSTTSACATITGNGTYAFIKYVADVSLLPQGSPACGVMTAAFPGYYEFNEFDGWMQYGVVIHDSELPAGTPISYQLIDINPAGFFTSGQSGAGYVFMSLNLAPGVYGAIVAFDPVVIFEYDYFENLESFTLRVFLPQCYTDFHFPEDLDDIPLG